MNAGTRLHVDQRPSAGHRALRALRHKTDHLGTADWLALGGLAVILLLAAIGPLIAPYSPTEARPGERLLAPSGEHWFGTGVNGDDIFSRIISAPRTDALVAIVATMLAVGIGAPLGVLGGFFEGGHRRVPSFLSHAVVRLCDVLQALPVFVLALVLVAVRGPSVINVIAALCFVNAPVFLRLARSEVLSLRERPYVEAARVAGNSDGRIAFRHLAPNAAPAVITQVSVAIGFSVLLTAGLSFVGAGVRPPTPELGLMISTGAQQLILGRWWPSVFPGIALGLMVFVFAAAGQTLGRLLAPEGRLGAHDPRDDPQNAATLGDPAIATTFPTTALVPPSDPGSQTMELDGASTQREHVTPSREVEDAQERPPDAEPFVDARSSADADIVLDVSNLTVEAGPTGATSRLLDGVSLRLRSGDVLGIVGESGSGKSVLVQALLRLLPDGVRVTDGEILFEGSDYLTRSEKELRRMRGHDIAAILPDARNQLNPVVRIGSMLDAVIRAHSDVDKGEARRRALAALESVGISDAAKRLASYPHELSGGMAQRVCIAMALVHSPTLLIGDEPTHGLDVTVQRQVLDLMAELLADRSAAQLIVTRDLGIVAHYCHRVAIMRAGRIVEAGPTSVVFGSPQHPYTKTLLDSSRAATSAASEPTYGGALHRV